MDSKSIEALDKYVDKFRQIGKSAQDMSEIIKEIINDIGDRDLVIKLTESFLELGVIEKDMIDFEDYICSKVKYDGDKQ